MPQNLSIRPMVYLLGIFQWRDHAGDLDGSPIPGGTETPLRGYDRWIALHPARVYTDEGRRLAMIKSELEDWLHRN